LVITRAEQTIVKAASRTSGCAIFSRRELGPVEVLYKRVKRPLAQADVYRMIRRRAFAAGIKTRIGNYKYRATGIIQYLRNGGRRELAQQMAAHESPRTTTRYDRGDDEVAVDELERIFI